MSFILFFLTVLVSMAAVEFLFLWRWFGRRSLAVCVISGAITSGIFWEAVLWMTAWHGSRAKAATEGPLTGSDMFVDFCVAPIVGVLVLSGLALIPAGFTAMIYRRFRSQT